MALTEPYQVSTEHFELVSQCVDLSARFERRSAGRRAAIVPTHARGARRRQWGEGLSHIEEVGTDG